MKKEDADGDGEEAGEGCPRAEAFWAGHHCTSVEPNSVVTWMSNRFDAVA